ncbi:MAG TPA: T9SS type A sorting domain-containing protein [Hanamia sp.]|nr:T9SS type A sorting domain-containing protein [Hanamia sp.]
MKNILLSLLCFAFLTSHATTWDVTVSNNQFSPASLNVAVGDVIHWVWSQGFHTTTSVGIPAGASSWDSPIDAGNISFNYTVTQPGTYSYQCDFHAPFMVASFTATSVLPVTLSAFDVGTQNNHPFLSWTTQTEINVDYFSIRRSTNGIDFKEIGKVTAAGNSTSENNYSFSDEEVLKGINYVYYALAIIDEDGKTQLSPIKIYKYPTTASRIITSLSPNPVSGMGHLMLQFNADKAGVMMVQLIDMHGQTVLKTKLSAERGINNGHIHLGDVPSGVYTIYFSLDGANESYRIVKK